MSAWVAFLRSEPGCRPPLPLISDREGLKVEKEFAVPATTRNWTTVGKIAELSR